MSDPTLFEYAGEVRESDPEASHRAARVITGGVETEVLAEHRRAEGLTDTELCRRLPGFHGPTLISARSRLARRGLLRDSGARRLTDRGRESIVWVVA